MNLKKDPANCSYCGSLPKLYRRDDMLFVQCTRCLAEGPKHPAFKHDAETQAIAAWNGNKMFGRMGIANLPPGMPAATGALAEWLKVISDSVFAGDYGFPDSGLMIFNHGFKRIEITPKSLSKSDAGRLMVAVLDDSRTRIKA